MEVVAVNLCLNLLLVMLTNFVQPEPVPESGLHSDCWSGLNNHCYSARARRSIPEIDAVNPQCTEAEWLPDQEEPVGPQNSDSPFALADHVSNFFRGRKSPKNIQKAQPKPVHEQRSVNVAREEDAIESEILPSDEQAECYKQQNIDPPGTNDHPQKIRFKSHGSQVMPIMDSAQRPQFSHIRSNINGKGGRHYEPKKFEKGEITSLYSDSEKNISERKEKHFPKPDHEDFSRRIYKPDHVEASFPVYDGDIDFDPDPLHGILDEEYWLDPQLQEEVIRKYMDLAETNMIPPETKYVKRSVVKSDPKLKSADSKVRFKDRSDDGRCHCKAVVACGDYSKSKGSKKSNLTKEDDGVSYGRDPESSDNELNNIPAGKIKKDDLHHARKLLSVNDINDDVKEEEYDKIEGHGFMHNSNYNRRNLLSLDYDVYEIKEEVYYDGNEQHGQTPKQKSSYIGRKLLSFKDKDIDVYGENNFDNYLINDNNVYLRRRILWEGDGDEEYYGENDDENEHVPDYKENSHSIDSTKGGHFQDVNKGISVSPEAHEVGGQKKRDNSIGSFRENRNQNLVYTENDFFVNREKPPGYYVSNKFANILQKPFTEKPKGPQTAKVNTSLEFELVRNETFINASVEQATEDPQVNKTRINKRGNERTDINKGRRSYLELPFIKHPPVMSLFQSADDFVGTGIKDDNKRANDSQSSTRSAINTVATTVELKIESTKNTTIEPVITTMRAVATVGTTITSKPKSEDQEAHATIRATTKLVTNNNSKLKSEDEEAVDAEVARDIVETVISESQRSPGLGRKLGLCRRNESLINVKYGRIVPETEKVLKTVSDCIMEKLKGHLAKQSCILMDAELLEFLKWMVLSGESYKDYLTRVDQKFFEFLPATTPNVTCPPSTTPTVCEPEAFPQPPQSFA